MHKRLVFAALLGVIYFNCSIASAETAQGSAAIENIQKGKVVYSSDGRLLGRVYAVKKDESGKPSSIELMDNVKIVHIPVSSLSIGDKGYTTTITKAEFSKNR